MKNQLTTTTIVDIINGKQKISQCIVHTSGSCLEIDNVLASYEGDRAVENAQLTISMHEAIQKAVAFIQGFEDDENQEDITALLENLRQFDVQ